jgi:hypothetical protein
VVRPDRPGSSKAPAATPFTDHAHRTRVADAVGHRVGVAVQPGIVRAAAEHEVALHLVLLRPVLAEELLRAELRHEARALDRLGAEARRPRQPILEGAGAGAVLLAAASAGHCRTLKRASLNWPGATRSTRRLRSPSGASRRAARRPRPTAKLVKFRTSTRPPPSSSVARRTASARAGGIGTATARAPATATARRRPLRSPFHHSR